jgi:hypothetical protein
MEGIGSPACQRAQRRHESRGTRRWLHYYDHWLAALEHLVTAKGLADSATLVARKEACADAYRRTPNGMQQSWPQAPLVDRRNAMQGNSESAARCRKGFASEKGRIERSASQPGNHVFRKGPFAGRKH